MQSGISVEACNVGEEWLGGRMGISIRQDTPRFELRSTRLYASTPISYNISAAVKAVTHLCPVAGPIEKPLIIPHILPRFIQLRNPRHKLSIRPDLNRSRNLIIPRHEEEKRREKQHGSNVGSGRLTGRHHECRWEVGECWLGWAG